MFDAIKSGFGMTFNKDDITDDQLAFLHQVSAILKDDCSEDREATAKED